MSKKTLYHSELNKMGIINARVNSEPTASKYPDRPKFVVLEIDGTERFYDCENEECEFALTGLKDTWVELEAHGSREEASIRIDQIEKPEDARKAIREAKEKIANLPDDRREPAPEKPARATTVPDEKPRPVEHQPELHPVEHDEVSGQIKSYAAHAGKIFALAWEESKHAMALIPTKDATELTAYEWLDLRIRIANGFQIEINKIIRKERF